MAIVVVPAYRVVARLARRVQGMPLEEALDRLEAGVRSYVQSLLLGVHPSLVELGVRTAVTQMGDPDPQGLLEGIEALEAHSPKGLVEGVLGRCQEALPRPDLSSRVLLLPGDPESRVLTRQMHGVIGVSLGSGAMLVFLWPCPRWQEWLSYTVAHEYAHLVRNHLFPRGLVGGRLVFLKSQEPETLLDAMVAEGVADAFALSLHPHMRPPWLDALSPEVEARLWPRFRRRLGVGDTAEIRRFLFGDGDRVPVWAGYTLGYRIVRAYLQRYPRASPADLVALSARAIYEAGGFSPRA